MEMPGVVCLPITPEAGSFCWVVSDSGILDFPHEHARLRTFRWGEDGIAGVSDTHGMQCISFAFWNEKE